MTCFKRHIITNHALGLQMYASSKSSGLTFIMFKKFFSKHSPNQGHGISGYLTQLIAAASYLWSWFKGPYA